jgi:hypothetical protein
MYKLARRSSFVLALLALAIAPAMAQNRFMDEAREKAARRAENAAVREAEHPETTATTKEANAQQPAKSQTSAPPAESQAAESAQTPAPAPAR